MLGCQPLLSLSLVPWARAHSSSLPWFKITYLDHFQVGTHNSGPFHLQVRSIGRPSLIVRLLSLSLLFSSFQTARVLVTTGSRVDEDNTGFWMQHRLGGTQAISKPQRGDRRPALISPATGRPVDDPLKTPGLSTILLHQTSACLDSLPATHHDTWTTHNASTRDLSNFSLLLTATWPTTIRVRSQPPPPTVRGLRLDGLDLPRQPYHREDAASVRSQ
jgi:hypothetical protein